MKQFIFLLVLATFAAVTPGRGQTAEQAFQDTGIHRATPKPDASAAPAKTATGPMEAALYKDAKGKEAATTFAPNDTVYLVVKNVTVAKGDKLGVAWFSGTGAKGKKVFASERALPDAGIYNPNYNLSPAKGGSPAGSYHVDFSMNSKVVKSLAFTVK